MYRTYNVYVPPTLHLGPVTCLQSIRCLTQSPKDSQFILITNSTLLSYCLLRMKQLSRHDDECKSVVSGDERERDDTFCPVLSSPASSRRFVGIARCCRRLIAILPGRDRRICFVTATPVFR